MGNQAIWILSGTPITRAVFEDGLKIHALPGQSKRSLDVDEALGHVTRNAGKGQRLLHGVGQQRLLQITRCGGDRNTSSFGIVAAGQRIPNRRREARHRVGRVRRGRSGPPRHGHLVRGRVGHHGGLLDGEQQTAVFLLDCRRRDAGANGL